MIATALNTRSRNTTAVRHARMNTTLPLPAGALLRLFECDWKWSMIGAGELRRQRLGDCVANELSNTFNRCGRAVSSLRNSRENTLMQLERGAIGLVISDAKFDAAFPHDISSSLHHCQQFEMQRCNASETGWTAEYYATRRYETMRRACERSPEYDSWKAHVQFMGLDWNVTRCVHSTRAEAERYQQAFLSLLERHPLPRPRRGGQTRRGEPECDPGPLWNQLMARWRLRDVVGVAYSAGARDAAMQVQAAIQRLSELFRDEASTRPMAAPKLFALTASLE